MLKMLIKKEFLVFLILIIGLFQVVYAEEVPYCLQKYSENGNDFWDGWIIRHPDKWNTLPGGNGGDMNHNSGGEGPLLTIPGQGKMISATYELKLATEDDFIQGPSGYGRRIGGGGHWAFLDREK